MKNTSSVLTLICVISVTCTHAKTGYFWHITDFHYDPLYTSQGDTRRHCRKADERGSSGHHRALGRYGDYSCESSIELIESAARYMRTRHSENVEFVLWTGDIIAARYIGSEEDKYRAIRNMTDLLSRTFSSHFVFPVLGHLDPAPSEGLTNLWMHWLPLEALQTFTFGGYYTIEQKQSKLRIVALNTNLFSVRESSSLQTKKQWEWLDGIMDKAHSNKEMLPIFRYCCKHHDHGRTEDLAGGKQPLKVALFYVHSLVRPLIHCTVTEPSPENEMSSSKYIASNVYIVGHAAPGSDSRHAYDVSSDANAKYLRTVRRHARIIAGQFFGHLHADTFRVIYDNDLPVSWAFLAPSVSPHRDPAGSSNPGLRLYKFDTNTGKVLDYTQYYLDLAAANRNVGAAEWIAEYNLTQYYGLHEVSANSLHNLADRLRIGSPHETTVFNKYFRAYTVKHDTTDSCDGACTHQHFCAITCLEHVAYRQCVEAAASALAAAGRSATLVAPLVTTLLTLFVFVLIFV